MDLPKWNWRALALGDPDASSAAVVAGLEWSKTRCSHPALTDIRSAGALAVISRRRGTRGLQTLVIGTKEPADWGPSELDAIDALSRSQVEPQPELRVYEDGILRLQVPLNGRGGPRLGLARTWGRSDPASMVQSCGAEGDLDPGLGMLEREWQRAQALALARNIDLGQRLAPLWAVDLPAGGAPHQLAGWYSRRANRLIMACGVARAAKDAIGALALAKFCRGSAGSDFGFAALSPDQQAFLTELESATPIPLANAEVRPKGEGTTLPRTVGVRYGGSVDRGRAAFGTAAGAEELHRIRAAGFGAVCFEVHVPVVSPGNRASLPFGFDAWAQAGSRPVTLEGDAAVLLAAEHARQAGLRVILWPRILTGPRGGLAAQQVVPSADHWRELSGRLRETSALVAGLANEMGAEGLVLFDLYLLPWDEEAPSDGHPAEPQGGAVESAVEAQRSARLAMLEGAAGFAGPKVCVAESTRALAAVHRAAEFRAAGVVLGLDRAAALPGPTGNHRHDVSRLTMGLSAAAAELGPDLQMIQVSVPGTRWARRGGESWGGAPDGPARDDYLAAIVESLKGANDVPFVVARGWLPGGGSPRGYDVSRWPLASQRSLAASR